MENIEIKSVLMSALPLQEVYVSNSGNHFYITAVSEMFSNMSQVEKQQTIYAPLIEYITNNRIHSLSIKAYSPQEWKLNSKLTSLN